ncbi:hypothetical protein BJ170DRAFT_374048 [Xylariales sp. AK1849]|nr:hypothetical protein BJ170DRAFT_374048 [Xylariales sp. AK1849]
METSPPDSQPCNRCKQNPASHKLRTDNVCSQCFISFVSAKVIKRLEVLQRATRGPRFPSKPPRYLVALSPGSVSSTVLLSILCENLRAQREKSGGSGGARTRFEVVGCVVDTDLGSQPGGDGIDVEEARDGDEKGESDVLARYRAHFPGITFIHIRLEEALHLSSIAWASLPALNTNLAPSHRLGDLLGRLPSTTSRSDMVRLFTRHLLLSAALREECSVLLLGYNTTSLAQLTLSETAKGRGFALPWLVNDGAFRLPSLVPESASQPGNPGTDAATEVSIPIYHPLRELFRKELVTYTTLTTPPLTPLIPDPGPAGGPNGKKAAAVVSHKDLSIDDVMARYFAEVEENYPSVVANVVRTTGKLNRSGSGEQGTCGLCGVGLDEVGDERWRGELGEQKGEARQDGEGEGRLCYGCDRSVYG